jgi:hypothetical protein
LGFDILSGFRYFNLEDSPYSIYFFMSGSFIIVKILALDKIPLPRWERMKVRVTHKEFCNGPIVG